MNSGRGFTLLEVVMASTLGAILLIAVMSLFSAITRTDRRAGQHLEATAGLQRMQIVMERALSGMVVSDGTTAVSGVGTPVATPTGQDENGVDVAPESIRNGVATTPLRPRVILEPDPRVRGAMDGLAPAAAGQSAGIQRLEVVLSKPPIPPGFVLGLGDSVQASGVLGDTEPEPGVVRGVFELRPDAMTVLRPDAPPPDPDTFGWTLWWRPLPPGLDVGLDDALAQDPTQDGRAVPIAWSLRGVRWTAYKQGQRLTSLSATQMLDLPGYMEMEVRTVSGLYANWMFELGWTSGKETGETPQQDEAIAEQGTEVVGGGTGGGGGRTGGGRTGEGGRDQAVPGRTRAVPQGGGKR